MKKVRIGVIGCGAIAQGPSSTQPKSPSGRI